MRFTRRLLEIELADLMPSGAAAVSEDSPLFFRVLSGGNETLAVELWDRGELLGKRSISVSMGRSQLHSRRIALAAVELARRAPQQARDRQARQTDAQARCVAAKSEAQAARERARLRLDSGIGVHTTGAGDTWLVGAALRPTLQWRSESTLGLELGMLQGRHRTAYGNPYLRWFEAGVVPGHDFTPVRDWSLSISLPVAFATVVTRGASELSGVPGQDTTWSARAQLVPRVARKLDDALWLELSPAVGWTLREVSFRDTEGDEEVLGGLWLGASLGLSVGPRH